MERTQYFTEQFGHYIESIRNLLQNQDKDIALLSYYFLRMLETKARLERYGEKVEDSAFSSCCESISPYKNTVLEHYEQSFGLFLPEKVLECARRIHDNLEILAPDSENTEAEEEEKEEILEEAFFLVIERESLELTQKEMEKVFLQYDFADVLTCLDEISYTFDDIYFPKALQAKLQEYVQENKVDIQKMPWFYRPLISEIPMLLNYEMEEIQQEAIQEDMEKNPLQKSPEEIREWLENRRRQNQPSAEDQYSMAAEDEGIETMVKKLAKRKRKNNSVDQDAEKKFSEEEE